MHELSITTHILEIVLKHAQSVHADRISHVYLVVGQLSSAIDESVASYWNMICEDTMAEGSRLHFHRIPAQFQCSSCRLVYPLTSQIFACPACGSETVHIVSGEKFYVESIEVEMPISRIGENS